MGFGYLLVGYLVTFLLFLIAENFGVGFFALLVGYAAMLYGLNSLRRYHPDFRFAAWTLFPLIGLALLSTVTGLSDLFGWGLSLPDAVGTAVKWAQFVLIMGFQFLMLYGIRRLSGEVGLPSISVAAARNGIFLGIYTVLYVVGSFPLGEDVLRYLLLCVTVVDLLCIICNLLLLLSCTKNICPAGDEDVAPRQRTDGFFDKMRDVYEKNRASLREDAQKEGERLRRRIEEKKNRKKNK